MGCLLKFFCWLKIHLELCERSQSHEEMCSQGVELLGVKSQRNPMIFVSF